MTRPTGSGVLGASPNRLDLGQPLRSGGLETPQQAALGLQRIQALSGIGPVFITDQFAPGTSTPLLYEDSAGTTAATVGAVVGLMNSLTGGLSASQATTANKSTLRLTPSTGIRWLDGNTATAAMTVTLPSAISNATTFVATPQGVVKSTGVNLGTSFSLTSPYQWFSGYVAVDAAVHGATTPAEDALITRFLSRYVPALGSELVVNGTFDTDISGWSPLVSATAVFDSGRIKITTSGGADGYAQGFSAAIGRSYQLNVTLTGGTSACKLRLYKNVNPYYEIETVEIAAGNTATISFTHVATQSTMTVYLRGSVGGYFFVDNISVREAL